MRHEVQLLQLMIADGVEARAYDLSILLSAIVDVRVLNGSNISADIDPALFVQGRSDRLAIAVDNLLVKRPCTHRTYR